MLFSDLLKKNKEKNMYMLKLKKTREIQEQQIE